MTNGNSSQVAAKEEPEQSFDQELKDRRLGLRKVVRRRKAGRSTEPMESAMTQHIHRAMVSHVQATCILIRNLRRGTCRTLQGLARLADTN